MSCVETESQNLFLPSSRFLSSKNYFKNTIRVSTICAQIRTNITLYVHSDLVITICNLLHGRKESVIKNIRLHCTNSS